jgi:hypothetical protein
MWLASSSTRNAESTTALARIGLWRSDVELAVHPREDFGYSNGPGRRSDPAAPKAG